MSEIAPAATAPVSSPAPDAAPATQAATAPPAAQPQAEAQAQSTPANAAEAEAALFGYGDKTVDAQGNLHNPDGTFAGKQDENAAAPAAKSESEAAATEPAAGADAPPAGKDGESAPAAEAPEGQAFARIAADGPLHDRLSKAGLLNERGELTVPLPQDVTELVHWAQNSFIRAADVGVAREEVRRTTEYAREIESNLVAAEARYEALQQQMHAMIRNPAVGEEMARIEAARYEIGDRAADAALAELMREIAAPADEHANAALAQHRERMLVQQATGLVESFRATAPQFFPLADRQMMDEFLTAWGAEIEVRESAGQQVDYSLEAGLRAFERYYVTQGPVVQQEYARIQQQQTAERERAVAEARASAAAEVQQRLEQQARNAATNPHGRLAGAPAASLAQINVNTGPRNAAEAEAAIFGYASA